MDNGIGERFAHVLSAKDSKGLMDLLDAKVDFRGMTPTRFWEASSAGEFVDDVMFGAWFEPQDRIDSLESVQVDSVGDRNRVSYRFRVSNPDGQFLVEQQAYFAVENLRISWLRIMCSGFRPVEGNPA